MDDKVVGLDGKPYKGEQDNRSEVEIKREHVKAQVASLKRLIEMDTRLLARAESQLEGAKMIMKEVFPGGEPGLLKRAEYSKAQNIVKNITDSIDELKSSLDINQGKLNAFEIAAGAYRSV